MVHPKRSARRFFVSAGCLGLFVLAGGFALWFTFEPRPAPALMLRQAIARIEADDDLGAARLLDQILKRQPGLYMAAVYRGHVARRLGDDRAAANYWALVPDDHPREAAMARFAEGQLALAAYRARDAERLYRHATELHPQYLEPRVRLIHLYQLQMRDADLRREMTAIRAERRLTGRELIFSTGSMGKANDWPSQVGELEKFVASDENDLDSLVALAECHIAADRAHDAIALLRASLARHPGDQALRGLLGETLVRQQDLARARDVLAQSPPPGDVSAPMARACGAYFSAILEWESAATWFERAVAIDEGHWPTAFHLGMALERAGRHEAAQRVLKRARLMEQVLIEQSRLIEQVGPQVWRPDSGDLRPSAFFRRIAVEIARLLVELGRANEATAWLEQALLWTPGDATVQRAHAQAVERAQSETAAATRLAVSKPRAEVLHALDATRLPAVPARLDVARHNSAQPIPKMLLADRHSEARLDFQYRSGAGGSKFILETLGGGVAAFDFDGDGWPDLYFAQGAPLPVAESGQTWRDRLFQNLEGSFRDVTESAGLGDPQYSQGCAAADFDNDGFADLAVANFGTNVLYHNNGDGTFTDVTTAAGIKGAQWSTSLAFADLDRDGDLDLYVVTYVLEPYQTCPDGDLMQACSPHNFRAEQDQLFMNRGDGTFEDVSQAAGIIAADGKGLGIVAADFDNDGWQDIYVANDTTPNFLYHNQTAQPGAPLAFEERGLASGSGVSGAGQSQAGMGIACGDLDGDGFLDLFVTNFYEQSATLYLNQGNLLFTDATRAARLDQPTRQLLGFGTQTIDVDLDGRLDLFVANGHVDDFTHKDQPWKMPPQLFYNRENAVFADVSSDCGAFFEGKYLGRAVARLDWDRDGRPDLAVVHLDRPAALLRNETPGAGRGLILELRGVESNRDAIGARIAVTSSGKTQFHEISGGDGFFAANERRLVVGVGRADRIERLEIRWPGGRLDRWTDLSFESPLVVIEGHPPRPVSLPKS